MKLQSAYPTIRLLVACLLLAIGLRTWLVMGLIDPVTVSGSSMVPAHRGTFVEPQCPVCEHRFSIGAEFAANVESMTCPSCAQADVPLHGLRLQSADRLWIDRLSLRWREPKRWETVVARNPQDANELCIKRIVGLPGELVALRAGNVRIDGAVLLKSKEDQRVVRQLIHHESARKQRWSAKESTQWRIVDSAWQFRSDKHPEIDWLRYRHPRATAITDDVTYNAGLTRKLNLVDEFLLSFELSLVGRGSLVLAINDGTSTAELKLTIPEGSLELVESDRNRSTFELAAETIAELSKQTVPVELTNFDQQLLLVINDQVVLRRPWPNTVAVGTASPFSIGVLGLDATLNDLRLYRDIYYSAYPVGAAPPATRRWLLGPDEFFLLGDNPPISIDSRLWGPVPARLIIGKPL